MVTKKGNKTVRFVFGILACLLVSALLAPHLGNVKERTRRICRVENLKQWRVVVDRFVTENGRLPVDFFEVANPHLLRSEWPLPYPLAVADRKFPEELWSGDRADFVTHFQYELLKGGDLWLIRERFSENDDDGIFAIDESGRIYESRR